MLGGGTQSAAECDRKRNNEDEDHSEVGGTQREKRNVERGGRGRGVIDAERRGMRLQLLTCKESAEGQLGKHQGLMSAFDGFDQKP